MCLCGGRWVGAYYKREKQPYNLSTSLRALTLVKSMEDLRLIKSGKTATGFSGLQDKKKKKKDVAGMRWPIPPLKFKTETHRSHNNKDINDILSFSIHTE